MDTQIDDMTGLDDARWSQVITRDEAAAGLFWYAVRTTGIFCRPGCPARRPARANVEFFMTVAAAKAAGYRACRRCDPTTTHGDDPTTQTVIEVCRRLEGWGEAPSLSDLADEVGWSSRHLSRRFKDVTGVTVAAYARSVRADRARDHLVDGAEVTEAAFDAGFGSLSAFYQHGADRLGTSPSRFRQGSDGLTVYYSTHRCGLGMVLVAATEHGVCAVRLGPDTDQGVAELEEELGREFALATVERDDAVMADLVDTVVELAEGRPPTLADLPLDIRGTAFQVVVWEAVRAIPAGEVLTYGQVAERIDRPTAHRAVAQAVAANPVALLVPCHRVVRADGGIGGYRWGVERKSALLTAEGEAGSEVRAEAAY